MKIPRNEAVECVASLILILLCVFALAYGVVACDRYIGMIP